jgi:hypothetical protein
MTAPPELPLTFRQELAPHLFKALAGGWSCAVVGLPGFGLSNLLRFVAEPRVAEHYWGEEADQSLLVYVEADRLLDADVFYRRLADETVAAAHVHQWPRAEQAALRRLAEETNPNSLTGFVQHVCGDLERRLVFVCDEVDAALAAWPPTLLRALRALRDAHKYRLAFVAGARRDPAWIAAERHGADPSGGAEKFAELFAQHTFPLKPYSADDARLAVARKTIGWARPPDEEQLDRLIRITGGHAKLLIAGLIYLEPRLHLPWVNVERGLLADPGLAEICRTLWQALEPADRRALWLLARDQRDAIPVDALKRLELFGLAAGGPAFVFSSIFETFVLAQPEAPDAPLRVSTLRDPAETVLW